MGEYALRPDTIEARQFVGNFEEDEELLVWVCQKGGMGDLICPRKPMKFQDHDIPGHGPQLLIQFRDKATGNDVKDRLEVGDWIIAHPGYGLGYLEVKTDEMFTALYAPTDKLEILREKLSRPLG